MQLIQACFQSSSSAGISRAKLRTAERPVSHKHYLIALQGRSNRQGIEVKVEAAEWKATGNQPKLPTDFWSADKHICMRMPITSRTARLRCEQGTREAVKHLFVYTHD